MPFNKLNHSILGEIRPRFRLKTNLSIGELKKIIADQLKEDPSVLGNVKIESVFIRIPAKDQHYWSPELQVNLEKDYDSEDTVLRCLVGPRQTVWAFFMFVYVGIAVLTLFLGMYGLTRWQLGEFNNFVYAIPIGILILPSIYTFSKIGQKTGRDQMMHLISFLYHAVDRSGNIDRVES